MALDAFEAGAVDFVQKPTALATDRVYEIADELIEKVTWLRLGALVVNLFAVAYIVWTKRLFGFRGGHSAFRAERRNDSLLGLEHASAVEIPARAT